MSFFSAVENLRRDIGYALRQMRKTPGFAVTAMLTLALGIGVNTAVFSVVNGLLFSSLHIHQENRVMVFGLQQGGRPWQMMLSLPEYHDLREQTHGAFSDVIAEQYGLDGFSLQGNQAERVFTDYVSGNYFQVLGMQPLLGRFFLPAEGETPGADPVMVLSYPYWKSYFHGDPNVVGRHISVDGQQITIIGVAPSSFHGVITLFGVQAFLPLAMVVPIENTPMADWSKRDNRGLAVYGRQSPGVTQQQADASLALVAKDFAKQDPSVEKDVSLRTFRLFQARTGNLDSQNTTTLVSGFFLSLAGLVLLLVCVNVTNLLMVRATVREHEMVIRSALGAQRSRLVRQMLTESILLALFGGAAGICLGLCGSWLLGKVDLQTDLPLYLNFGFDWHVFAFSAGIALLAGAVVGLLPALRLARVNLNLILREGGRGVTGGGKFRNALVVVQVGGALLLLVLAGLFTRSLALLEHVDLGFNASHVLSLMVDPSEIGYNDTRSRDLDLVILERIRALPGVTSASTATAVPMGLISNSSDAVSVPGYQLPPGQSLPAIPFNIIGLDYFHTLETPIVRGRDFAASDDEHSLRVAIVGEMMAKKYWPNQDPIGHQFTMSSDASHPLQIVGVARDARYHNISGSMSPYFYIPFAQHYQANTLQAFDIRTAADPVAMIPEIDHAIHSVAPALPLFEVKTFQQSLHSPNGLLIFEVVAAMAAIMGALGLLLAGIGVYGVLSYVVSQKTREIGIRMAVGAQHADILRIVYRQGLWIVVGGLLLGLGASFGIAHILRSALVVSAADPVTYIGVSVTLLTVALIACYIPARRAMRVEPMEALRME
jgi:macrolide transport system ATP-binding/permease protein